MADEEKQEVIDTEKQEEVAEETPKEEKEEEKPAEEEETKEEEDVKPEDVDLDNPDEVSNALDKKGIDYTKLTEEYLTLGKLSDASMKKLEKAGIPPEIVNSYISGYEAKAELERNELAECVGGREAMDEIIKWASHNLKQEEIIALNAIRNKFELESVLIGLKSRMEEKEGKTPEYQKGTGDTKSVNGFNSQAEMFAAIQDPKYKKDEFYRSEVQKKIAASREAGIDLGIY